MTVLFAGHTGSHIGWAIVQNPAVAAAMRTFIENSGTLPGLEAQLKAAQTLEAILQTRGTPLLDR
jgi:hypothetical protein